MDAYYVSQKVLDRYTAMILLETSRRAASAADLSSALGIPIAACYRRLRELESLGLMFCNGTVPSKNGKSIATYRCALQSARVAMEGSRLHARIEVASPRGSGRTKRTVFEGDVGLEEPAGAAPGRPGTG